MKPLQTLMLIAAVLVGAYVAGYGVLRVTGVIVHRWGWEFDPVGAGEPQAPAIHRVEGATHHRHGWRRAIVVAVEVGWMPLRAAEAAWWRHREPTVQANDPRYLRAR